jgi:membrane-bound serine protease (ClpP class)
MPFVLWAVGLLLIFIEFYVPGAVMGISGGILIFVSVFMFANQTQAPLWIALYVLGAIASVALVIKYALVRIRTAKPNRSIYSNHDQEGYVASKYDHSAIGKRGIVLSDLKPGGYILIDGKQHQALSQSGYLVKGTEVLVIGGQEESLIVKNIKKDEKS